jgi:tRNA U34 5-methylaminomethyl-2-thiouridine-forming methyltransferase MnmC
MEEHKSRELKIIPTGDGSSTIYIPELDEHYHSVHGSMAEAKHVFVQHGYLYALEKLNRQPIIAILEVGFGTGLNATLLAEVAIQKSIPTRYVGIEPYPLNEKVINELSYPDLNASLFNQIHQAPWNCEHPIDTNFSLTKIQTSLLDFHPEEKFGLICYDAFGPKAQPDMWTSVVFNHLHHLLNPSGILTTYCAKGQVKRDLKSVGFQLETLPGPPGKREMVRVRKC